MLESRVSRWVALVLLGCGVSLAGAQPPVGKKADSKDNATSAATKPVDSPAKSPAQELEEMLDAASRNNPDILLAGVKVREADAELHRVRMRVLQRITDLSRLIDAQAKILEYAGARIQVIDKLYRERAGATALLDYYDKRSIQLQEEVKLTTLKSERDALLGKAPKTKTGSQVLMSTPGFLYGDVTVSDGGAHWARNQLVEFPIHLRFNDLAADRFQDFFIANSGLQANKVANPQQLQDGPKKTEPPTDKIRKLLETPVKVQFRAKSAKDMLQALQKMVPGIRFVIPEQTNLGEIADLDLGEPLPLSVVLQALTDTFRNPPLQCVVRDYGILVTTHDDPIGRSLRVQEFRKPRQTSMVPQPPPEVEGQVTGVDTNAKSELIKIGLGSDSGLTMGHILELFRLSPEPKYLGKVKVVEVKRLESTAQPVNKLREPAKPGDRVATSVPEK